MLATYYTLLKDNAPTPEEMRQKSREYMLMKPKKYSFSALGTSKGETNSKGRHGTSQEMIWTNDSDFFDSDFCPYHLLTQIQIFSIHFFSIPFQFDSDF